MATERDENAIHEAAVLDQFTRQADPFVRRHAHSHNDLLAAMADCAAVTRHDSVLDVACGPGIVSCFFARHARHVTGLDMVPAMLERARKFQSEQNVPNVTWQPGSSSALPFSADCFDCVVTRFSFHHFLEPEVALSEMKRVAKPGGTVLVCDVAPDAATQESFNHWEILRDPSHTRALTEEQFEQLGRAAGLELSRKARYTLVMDLEDLLAGSFPHTGDAERIRSLFAEGVAAGTNHLGVAAQRTAGGIQIAYPVVVLAWRRPG